MAERAEIEVYKEKDGRKYCIRQKKGGKGKNMSMVRKEGKEYRDSGGLRETLLGREGKKLRG